MYRPLHQQTPESRRSACAFALLLVLFVSVFTARAQNHHYSQFYTAPVSMNPALTGAYDGIFRINANQRTQWLSVTKPYLTFGIGADGAIYKNHRRQELLGIGGTVNTLKAGDVGYTSTQALVSVSFIKYVGRQNRNKIGIGAYAGMFNNFFDLNAASWDEQFQHNFYNPYLGSGEEFLTTKQYYFDMGAGAFWSISPNRMSTYQLGFSAAHLNQPKETFGTTNQKLPARFTAHFLSRIGLTSNLALEPMAMASWQRTFHEYVFGTNIEYFQRKNNYTTLFSLGGGIFYRWNDAIIADVFFDWQNLRLGVSYDVNISSFRVATHGRGALEISLSYIFRRKSVTRTGKEPCPYDVM